MTFDPVELIVEKAGQPEKQPVVVMPSVGSETVAVVSNDTLNTLIGESEGLISENGKTHARSLSVYDTPKGKRARITLHTGREVEVDLDRVIYEGVAAGSATNIAIALSALGRTTAIGVIGAVGKGTGGTTLINSLGAHGFHHRAMLHRRLPTGDGQGGTASSLWLITHNGRTTSFSYKPPYFIPHQIQTYLHDHLIARIVICTGFMPYEMDLVQAAMQAETPEVRVVSPHQACYESAKDRSRCLDLARDATLFHVNGDELASLLAVSRNWHEETAAHIQELLGRIPARIVCVTLSEHGSITYLRDEGRTVRQGAFQIKCVRNPVGAGDIHLSALIYYLWIRTRPIHLEAALDMAAWVAARKLEAGSEDGRVLRPAGGIPESAVRKDVVHAAEARHASTTPAETTS